MDTYSNNSMCVGLDEVGRGALAGPLAVGAVILPYSPRIIGLDDSKKISPKRREQLCEEIKRVALSYAVAYILPHDIDAYGMASCIKTAFKKALDDCVNHADIEPEYVFIDGNPLNIHPKEVNVVKGDATIACISAASIVAKVSRDALMIKMARQYPEYHFDSNKGYGSAQHIAAIRAYGPSKTHRQSFLGKILH